MTNVVKKNTGEIVEKVRFKTEFARRLPDPIFNEITHHFYWVKGENLATNIPDDPNVREKNLNLAVYRDVKDSYLNRGGFTPFTFHLKNNGINIIADYVDKVGENEFEVQFEDGEGCLNGGHTKEIILNHREEMPEQYVLLRITTKIHKAFIPEMAGGLNSNIKVDEHSLLNKKGAFNWIKDVLNDYKKDIAFKENVKKEMDIRDIIAIMTLFNIDLYPTDGTGHSKHPSVAYSRKSKCLEYYQDEFEKEEKGEGENCYKKFKYILEDIMKLHDIIKMDSVNKHDGYPKRIDYFERKKDVYMKLIFINEEKKLLLRGAGLYPILATFRIFIEENEDGYYQWKFDNGLDDVLGVWEKYGERLMGNLYDLFKDLGRNVNSLGKKRITWENLYSGLITSYFSDLGVF